jgi:hypothetical protein
MPRPAASRTAVLAQQQRRTDADRHLTLVRSLAPFTETDDGRAPYRLREWREEDNVPEGVILHAHVHHAGAHAAGQQSHVQTPQATQNRRRPKQLPPALSARNHPTQGGGGGPSLGKPVARRDPSRQLEQLVKERASFAMRHGGPVAGIGMARGSRPLNPLTTSLALHARTWAPHADLRVQHDARMHTTCTHACEACVQQY